VLFYSWLYAEDFWQATIRCPIQCHHSLLCRTEPCIHLYAVGCQTHYHHSLLCITEPCGHLCAVGCRFHRHHSLFRITQPCSRVCAIGIPIHCHHSLLCIPANLAFSCIWLDVQSMAITLCFCLFVRLNLAVACTRLGYGRLLVTACLWPQATLLAIWPRWAMLSKRVPNAVCVWMLDADLRC